MIFCVVPTLLYNHIVLERFRRPFADAALLQSCRMYAHAKHEGNDTRTWLEREEYRRWLVDCHKACYLPTCMSGGNENLLTAEPAIVISETDDRNNHKRGSIGDDDDGDDDEHDDDSGELLARKRRSSIQNPEYRELQKSMRRVMKKQNAQKGGILRRQRFNI